MSTYYTDPDGCIHIQFRKGSEHVFGKAIDKNGREYAEYWMALGYDNKVYVSLHGSEAGIMTWKGDRVYSFDGLRKLARKTFTKALRGRELVLVLMPCFPKQVRIRYNSVGLLHRGDVEILGNWDETTWVFASLNSEAPHARAYSDTLHTTYALRAMTKQPRKEVM